MNRYLALLAAALVTAAAGAADSTTTAYSKQVPVGATDRVSISNVAGSLDITTWDRKEVDIQGELGPDVERVDVRQGEGSVDIRVIIKEHRWNDNSWKNDSWKKRYLPSARTRTCSDVMAETSA